MLAHKGIDAIKPAIDPLEAIFAEGEKQWQALDDKYARELIANFEKLTKQHAEDKTPQDKYAVTKQLGKLAYDAEQTPGILQQIQAIHAELIREFMGLHHPVGKANEIER